MELVVVYYGCKCYKVFSLKMKKKNHQQNASHLKNIKNSSHIKRYKKGIEKVGGNEKQKV